MPKVKKGFKSNGQFAKGNKVQSHKRTTPSKSFMKKLEEALLVVEKKEGKSLAQHAIEMAYTDKTILVAVLKKFAPDLAQVKVEPNGDLAVTFNIKDFRKDENKKEESPGI